MKQNHTKHIYFSFFNPFKVKANSKWEVYCDVRAANAVQSRTKPVQTKTYQSRPLSSSLLNFAGCVWENILCDEPFTHKATLRQGKSEEQLVIRVRMSHKAWFSYAADLPET